MKKIAFTLILACFSVMVSAQETKEPSKQPVSKEVAAIRTASNLAKYGYENYSPTALIEAARILTETPTQPLEPESVTKGEGEDEKAKQAKPEFVASVLLADARKLADGDPTVLALAEDVEKLAERTESRGRVGGAGQTRATVSANGTDTYTIKFWSGELAEILVSGDGDTDLDLYVYDQNGNPIVADRGYSDDCYVSWVPAWTGPFIVKVVNHGYVYNNYIMLTN